jgi:hypothetical protein
MRRSMVPSACAGAFCLPPRGASPSVRRRLDAIASDVTMDRHANATSRCVDGRAITLSYDDVSLNVNRAYSKRRLLGAKRGHWTDRQRPSGRDDGRERSDDHEHDGDRRVDRWVVRRLLEQRAPELRGDRRGNCEPNR